MTIAKTVTKKPVTKKPAAKVVKKVVKAVAKAVVKKVVAKKVTKVVKEKPVVHITPVKEVMNRVAQMNAYTEELISMELPGGLELTERQAKLIVKTLFKKQHDLILGSIHHRGSGEFTITGMMKIVTKKIPAKKIPARDAGTVYSALLGREIEQEARAAFTKPATVRVKIRPLRNLKDAAVA